MTENQIFEQDDINIAFEVGRLRGDVNGLSEWKDVFESRIDESIQQLREQNERSDVEMRTEMRTEISGVSTKVDAKFGEMHEYINERVGSLHTKFDDVITSNNEAKVEAGKRLPKWSKWFFGIVIMAIITMAGWAVDVSIHAHG